MNLLASYVLSEYRRLGVHLLIGMCIVGVAFVGAGVGQGMVEDIVFATEQDRPEVWDAVKAGDVGGSERPVIGSWLIRLLTFSKWAAVVSGAGIFIIVGLQGGLRWDRAQEMKRERELDGE